MKVRQERVATPFALTRAQQALADEVRQLAADELRPLAEAGEPGRVNRGLIQAMGRMGLLARLFPGAAAERSSRTAPATELCLLWEALATETTDAAIALILQGLGTYPVLQFGPAEQVQRWLPAVAAGEAVAGLAVAEPGNPADGPGLAVELAAEPDGDDWRLSGEKTWVYNAPDADFYTVFARMPEGTRGSGIGVFLVPAIRPGLSGERLEVTGALPLGCLTFDGVPVVRDDLLGEPGQGHLVAAHTRAAFRPSVGAFAAGIAGAALAIAVDHAATRIRSGAPGGRRSVRQLLAEMATRTEASRLLVYAAAAARDAVGGPVAGQDAMAELFAAETAQFVVDAAMQLAGADALRLGHPLEHLAHRTRAMLLCQGPPDLRYAVIVSELTGLAPAAGGGTPGYEGLPSIGPGRPHGQPPESHGPGQPLLRSRPIRGRGAEVPGEPPDGGTAPDSGAELDPDPEPGDPEPGDPEPGDPEPGDPEPGEGPVSGVGPGLDGEGAGDCGVGDADGQDGDVDGHG